MRKEKWVKLLLLQLHRGYHSREIKNYKKYEYQLNSKGIDILKELLVVIIQIKNLNKRISAKQIHCL